VASKVGFMDEGKIIIEGEPDKLKRSGGLEKVLNIETSIKNEVIAKELMKFSDDEKYKRSLSRKSKLKGFFFSFLK